jgi:hypothetical protein
MLLPAGEECPVTRREVENVVERLIALLDAIDGDPDDEPQCEDEGAQCDDEGMPDNEDSGVEDLPHDAVPLS